MYLMFLIILKQDLIIRVSYISNLNFSFENTSKYLKRSYIPKKRTILVQYVKIIHLN